MKKIKKIIIYCLLFLFLFSVFVMGINSFVEKSGDKLIYDIEDAKKMYDIEYIFVLGCKVWGEEPSPMLKDRLDVAIDLYKSGVSKKIFMSGDGSPESMEVQKMKEYAIDKGVPEKDIEIDPEGYNTITSMKRAKKYFDIDSMIVVTQEFHLSRSVYNASAQGIEVYGVVADSREYAGVSKNWAREIPARVKDFFLNFIN